MRGNRIPQAFARGDERVTVIDDGAIERPDGTVAVLFQLDTFAVTLDTPDGRKIRVLRSGSASDPRRWDTPDAVADFLDDLRAQDEPITFEPDTPDTVRPDA